VAEVWVYGDKRYLDKNQRFVGEYDISFLFVYYNELWDTLLTMRKRYVGKVKVREITEIMLKTLPDFYSYLPKIALLAMKDLVEYPPFNSIAKNETFKVTVGDYMVNTTPVFVETKNKNDKKLAKWFEERLENTYTFGDYSNLDFSGKTFTFTEFRYAQFHHSCLRNANLQGSALIGASFFMAQMEHCCLDNCSIYETDFSHAKLQNASFVNARGQAGLPDVKEWRYVGFLPISFRNADLTEANFTGANLSGADFTGAILDGAIFTDTILDGAIFSGNTGVSNR